MHDSNIVIILKLPSAKILVDPADAHHAVVGEFRCTERTHTGGTEHVNSLRKGPQDLLVPDCRDGLELAVNQTDSRHSNASGAIYITLTSRGQPYELRISE